jgi:hypothetical protein
MERLFLGSSVRSSSATALVPSLIVELLAVEGLVERESNRVDG